MNRAATPRTGTALVLKMGQEVVCFCITLSQQLSSVQLFLLFMPFLFHSQAIFPSINPSFSILYLLLSILNLYYNSSPPLPPFLLLSIPQQSSSLQIISHLHINLSHFQKMCLPLKVVFNSKMYKNTISPFVSVIALNNTRMVSF